MTRVVRLLGKPVSASLSPRMQNAAFAAAGLDWRYEALELEPEELPAAVRALDAGANVTIPYKVDVMALCDELEPGAVSVNTLVRREDGSLHGSSTDGLAVVEAAQADGARARPLGGGGPPRPGPPAPRRAAAQGRIPPRRPSCRPV